MAEWRPLATAPEHVDLLLRTDNKEDPVYVVGRVFAGMPSKVSHPQATAYTEWAYLPDNPGNGILHYGEPGMTTDELLTRLQEAFPGMPWERANELDGGQMSIVCIEWAAVLGANICAEYAPTCRPDFPWRLRGMRKPVQRFATLNDLIESLAADLFVHVGWWKNSLAEVDEVLTARLDYLVTTRKKHE